MNKIIKTTDAKTGEVSELVINESLSVGQTFRLIGRAVTFVARKVYAHPVCGPMVEGVSVCGRFKTGARVCDTAAA